MPKKERKNGRDYREYTPEDVEILREIATLRRAWFTMDEIARMQQDPDAIEEIFPQYRQWLEQQKMTLESLLNAARAVNPGKGKKRVGAVQADEGSRPYASACGGYSAKVSSISMHWSSARRRWNRSGRSPCPGAWRTAAFIVSLWQPIPRTKSCDDLGVAFGQLRDAMTPERESSPGGGREGNAQKCSQRLDKVGELALTLGAVWTAIYIIYLVMTGGGHSDGWGLPVPFSVGICLMIVGAVGMGAAKGIAAYRGASGMDRTHAPAG